MKNILPKNLKEQMKRYLGSQNKNSQGNERYKLNVDEFLKTVEADLSYLSHAHVEVYVNVLDLITNLNKTEKAMLGKSGKQISHHVITKDDNTTYLFLSLFIERCRQICAISEYMMIKDERGKINGK